MAVELTEITAACEEAHILGIIVTTDAHVPYLEWAIEEGVDLRRAHRSEPANREDYQDDGRKSGSVMSYSQEV